MDQGAEGPDTAHSADQFPDTGGEAPGQAARIIIPYLLERVPEFRELHEIRLKGWKNPAGDRFFAKQRRQADQADEHTKQYFYTLMQRIAQAINNETGAFSIQNSDMSSPNRILDTCMAPGGFLSVALGLNMEADAIGFSLPVASGGHNILLPAYSNVEIRLLDVTMLAADLGTTDIPHDHPERDGFLPKQLQRDDLFDLAICDGQVLRTHSRMEYQERREARRLTTSQLAIGLSHLKPGGTMVVLLHKLEAWDTVLLLHRFSKFSKLRLFKPKMGHAKRSSFYMVAQDVQSQDPEALHAVERWREIWKAATFGSEEEYVKAIWAGEPSEQEVLDAFGPELIRMGKQVWITQARALAKASFNN
ncbi:hypothetical protein B0I35DRAFT_361480 [Stachybotrys elegans]|uniref:Ribosomal RNA methyltransferase FtsJ domain-containing protein n=1 Tax=Stachybotrys elegans TaxID=80388 RepID=A0A8K0SEE6_9HYPO|nr:hypothetical protein B0I35DRAFT_361480 [Stachybotrys elegans]